MFSILKYQLELTVFFILLVMLSPSLILVLSTLGLAQAIFLVLYLLSLKKGNKEANSFLAFILLGLTIRVGKSVLNTYMDLEAWQRNLGISAILMVGPMLFFYGKAILNKQRKLTQKLLPHLVPFFLFVLLAGIIPNRHDFVSKLIYLLVFVHLALYIGFSAYGLWHKKDTTSPPIFIWYRNLVFGVALVCLFYIGNFLGAVPFYIGGAIFFSLLIYCFSFLLLKRHNFALEKYQASRLDTSETKQLVQKIKLLLEKDTLYLDPKLSLEKVAGRMGTSSRNVSRAINEHDGTNFSDFVNTFRIEKAKELLVSASYATEKIATIAYDCGFGNVTSFNLAFKAATKHTPSSYRKTFGGIST